MKTWVNPEVEKLEISCTEQGGAMTNEYDDVRVDQYDNLWVSFKSGNGENPKPTGKVEQIN